MQARVVLAILAVLMMSTLMLSSMATAYMMFALGPIAVGGLVILFCAISCGWRCGIYIFMLICVAGLLYAAYNIHVILDQGPVWKNPLSFTWYTLQILFESLSLIVSCWVLGEMGCDLVMEDCSEILTCKGCGTCNNERRNKDSKDHHSDKDSKDTDKKAGGGGGMFGGMFGGGDKNN